MRRKKRRLNCVQEEHHRLGKRNRNDEDDCKACDDDGGRDGYGDNHFPKILAGLEDRMAGQTRKERRGNTALCRLFVGEMSSWSNPCSYMWSNLGCLNNEIAISTRTLPDHPIPHKDQILLHVHYIEQESTVLNRRQTHGGMICPKSLLMSFCPLTCHYTLETPL